MLDVLRVSFKQNDNKVLAKIEYVDSRLLDKGILKHDGKYYIKAESNYNLMDNFCFYVFKKYSTTPDIYWFTNKDSASQYITRQLEMIRLINDEWRAKDEAKNKTYLNLYNLTKDSDFNRPFKPSTDQSLYYVGPTHLQGWPSPYALDKSAKLEKQDSGNKDIIQLDIKQKITAGSSVSTVTVTPKYISKDIYISADKPITRNAYYLTCNDFRQKSPITPNFLNLNLKDVQSDLTYRFPSRQAANNWIANQLNMVADVNKSPEKYIIPTVIPNDRYPVAMVNITTCDCLVNVSIVWANPKLRGIKQKLIESYLGYSLVCDATFGAFKGDCALNLGSFRNDVKYFASSTQANRWQREIQHLLNQINCIGIPSLGIYGWGSAKPE
jgi:hypothetical protein